MTQKRRILIFWIPLVFLSLLAIGPNFVRSRSSTAMDSCINHLRQIDAAKQQWALKNNKTNGPVTWNDVLPYMGRNTMEAMPLCPQGGTYILGNIGDLPKCSSGGDHHTLPE